MAILDTEITTLLDEDEQYYLLPRTVLKAIADDNGNYISNAITAAHINSIPNKLPKYSAGASDWDTAPVANSTKPVTSGGVYDAINAISVPYYEDYTVTTSANSSSPLGYYGQFGAPPRAGYTLISATVLGSSGYVGFVTINSSNGGYLWATSADHFTVRALFAKY